MYKKNLTKIVLMFLISFLVLSIVSTKTYSIDTENVIFTVGKYVFRVGGQPFTLDVPPFWDQKNESFLIPVRAFSELLKYSVDWDRISRKVILSKGKRSIEIYPDSSKINTNENSFLALNCINRNGRILIDELSIRKIFNVKSLILVSRKEIEFIVPREEIRIDAKDFTLKDVDGIEYNLYSLLGKKETKLVILNFWATYCPFCLKELPRFVALDKEYRKKGVVLLGLNTDTSNTEEMRELVIKKYGIEYPVLLDINSVIYDLYSVSGVPNLFIVDKNREIILHHLGSNDDYFDYLKSYLDNYLSR